MSLYDFHIHLSSIVTITWPETKLGELPFFFGFGVVFGDVDHRRVSVEEQARIARGIHCLPKVSPGDAIPNPSMPCGQTPALLHVRPHAISLYNIRRCVKSTYFQY
jgi:hypothetical protein